MMAIGAIADSLERIADSLDQIHSRLYEMGGLIEDDLDKMIAKK